MRRKKYVQGILGACLAALLAGCGSSTTQSPNPPTGLKKRVLVSNQQTGVLNIIDALKDVFSPKVIPNLVGASRMVTAAGTTAIVENRISQITIFDNATEQITFAPLTADVVNDVVISPDGKFVWLAERNNGFVQAVDTTTGLVVANIPIAGAARLALSPNGTKLLVFADVPVTTPPQPNTNTFWVIDTAAVTTTASKTADPISAPAPSAGSPLTLDQPFTAVFSGSETQAFILNCGVACGGGSGTPLVPASVVKADFTSVAAPSFSAVIPVPGATAGLISGNSLFVAGTPSLSATGTLVVIDTASLSLVGAGTQITNGTHTRMVLAGSKLYINSLGCTPGPVAANNTRPGCLTIADVSGGNPGAGGFPVAVPPVSSLRQSFDVTGIQPISGRNIVYVVEGGELDFYDLNTDAISTAITPLDIVGKAIDVVQIDP